MDSHWNATTKDVIAKICKYLNDNTVLKYGQAKTKVKNTYSEDQKRFLFDLLLLVGLINELDKKSLKPYSNWKDYLDRKSGFNKSTDMTYKITTIGKITTPRNHNKKKKVM